MKFFSLVTLSLIVTSPTCIDLVVDTEDLLERLDWYLFHTVFCEQSRHQLVDVRCAPRPGCVHGRCADRRLPLQAVTCAPLIEESGQQRSDLLDVDLRYASDDVRRQRVEDQWPHSNIVAVENELELNETFGVN